MTSATGFAAGNEAAVLKDIPYRLGTKDRHATLDVYLPRSAVKPPLLIFVRGGFWLLSDDEYRIGPSIAVKI